MPRVGGALSAHSLDSSQRGQACQIDRIHQAFGPSIATPSRMDASEKTVERLLDWFRNTAPKDGVRVFDDNDGVTIVVDGRLNLCKLAAFLLHGNATHTPGPDPAAAAKVQSDPAAKGLSDEELLREALQNLPPSLVKRAE